jgi:hypothetical protein
LKAGGVGRNKGNEEWGTSKDSSFIETKGMKGKRGAKEEEYTQKTP